MYDLQQQGSWLFKRRSYLPFLTIALFVVQLRTYTYPFKSALADAILELLCFAIALIGLAIRIHTVGHAPRGTSGRTTTTPRATTLNRTGMYSIVRHPLYLGNMLIWLSITLFLHSVVFTLACMALFVLYYERIILSEQAYLQGKFGQAYVDWAARTPMLLPRWRNWVRPSLPFCWKSVLKREYTGLFVISTALTLLEIAGDLFSLGYWNFEWTWAIVFCVGTTVYLVLRTLKKRGMLDVAGR